MTTNKANIFGRLLRMYRQGELGMTINRLSELSGVSAMYISNMESGKRGATKPSKEIIDKLSTGLNLNDYKRSCLSRGSKGNLRYFLEIPGVDADKEENISIQQSDRIERVYTASRFFEELTDENYFETVSKNVLRGVKYHYFFDETERFNCLLESLRRSVGIQKADENVFGYHTLNPFLFSPEFNIINFNNPSETMGIYVKTGSIYRMKESSEIEIDRKLETITRILAHDNSYNSQHLGMVNRVHPPKSSN